MTEQEWRTSTDPVSMLTFARPRATEQRLRVFALTCCREVWGLSTDEATRAGLQIIEYAVQNNPLPERAEIVRVRSGEMIVDCSASDPVGPLTLNGENVVDLYAANGLLAFFLKYLSCWPHSQVLPDRFVSLFTLAGLTPARQAELLREVVYPHFRPLVIQPTWLSWNGGTVRQIADAVDKEGLFNRLPVLGDALEEAGCDNADVLDHCRQPGEHVRGCWVLDRLLGKE